MGEIITIPKSYDDFTDENALKISSLNNKKISILILQGSL